ncbi:MAG: RHS famlily protein, partial [Richelia sp. SL_2_1]|nr:RHS famlily protein [Richelia sp. SL_2_1]
RDYELAELPYDGEYTLVFEGRNQANNNYDLRIVTPELLSASYNFGETISSSISEAGEQDIYTFEGTLGQQLFFDALNGNTSLNVRLYTPSDILLIDKDTNSDWLPFDLPETGTYRLVVDGSSNTIGDYSFILSDRNSAQTITLDTPITDNLNPGNKVNFYKFAGKSGQILNFDLAADSWNGANWVLYDPSGTPIKTLNANSPDFNATLGTSGSYTLAIVGNSNNPVNYSLLVTDVSVTPITNTGLEVVQSGTLNAGEVIDYEFTATASTLILFDGQVPGNNEAIRARLLNPDGTFVFSDHEAREHTAPILLEQTGTYKLQTFGYYSYTTGEYGFKLLELPKNLRNPNLNYLEIGTAVSGELNALSDKVYTFDGVQGQKFAFNAMIGTNVKASLYDANGKNIFSQSDFKWSGDRGPFTLTQDGLYYLVIANDSAASNNYSFELLDLTTAPDITYNVPAFGSISNGQQSQFFKIEAKEGDRLYFDSISSQTPGDASNYHWRLYGPGNNQLFDTEQRYDTSIDITHTGEYYLYIQGGPDAGFLDYNFRVIRHQQSNADIVTPGTGETASNNSDSLGIFNVKLAAKDVKGAKAIQDFNIKLLPDPDNANPVITTTPKTRFGLVDKFYRYQLQSVDPDGDPLTYRLLDEPLGALIDNNTGELLWFPESTVTTGSQVNFKVEVNDRRGGKDVQSFTVDVYDELGRIQGAVFDDLNGNGLLDSKLIKGDDPSIIFAIDISGSTAAPFFGEEGDKSVKTVLDAQVAAANAMIDAVVASGEGDRIKFGIIPHQYDAVIQDMDESTEGLQIYTTANADIDGNGIADIREILETYRPGTNNNFTNALQTIDSLLDALPGNPNLIFMSDGYGPLDPTVASQVVTDIKARGGNVTAFGVGLYSTIETIQKIDPDAEQIIDFGKLIDIFSGFDEDYALEPFKENVTVYLDLNNNGILEEGEPSQLTKKDTSTSILSKNRYYYTFEDLLPGTYTVRTVVPDGYTLTTPASGAFVDTVTVNGEDFIHLWGVSKVSEAANTDPVFVTTPSPVYKIKAGESLIYRANALDANADPLTYSLILEPPGMTVDKTSGTVVWNPSKQQVNEYYQELRDEQERLAAIGRGEFARKVVDFNVPILVRDGKGGQAIQYIKVELVPDNNAPVFTSVVPENAIPQIGKTWNYQVSAQDADDDVLTYSLTPDAPTDVTIDSGTGLLQWTPQQQGKQEFTIKVTDSKGESALQVVSLDVSEALPNSSPVITSTPRTNIRLGNTYLYKIEANDPDGDRLSYSLDSAPQGMTIDSGVVSWVPQANQFGSQQVTVRVSDGELASIQSFNINVTNQLINNAPTITSVPELITNIDKVYQYNVTGSDVDGDYVVWSIEDAPLGMVINPQTGALRWNPTSEQIGKHTVAVRLTDANGAYVGQEFTLYVNGINTPPQIVSTPITRAAINQDYKYQIVATDPENDKLTYSLGNSPAGMTVSENGLITWTPEENQLDDINVSVFVTDTQGATSNQSFTIEIATQEVEVEVDGELVVEVVPVAINNAPLITSNPVYIADTNSTYEYQVVANDPDTEDTLTYQLLSVPDTVTGMSINATTGLLTWDNPVAGSYQIAVGAVDNFGLGAAQGFTLRASANNAPVIQSTPGNIVNAGSTYSYDVKAVDVDGDVLNYTLDQASLDKGISIDELGRLRWKTKQGDTNHSAIVTVADGNGGSTQQEVEINVVGDTVAPKVRLIAGFNFINKGENVTFQARATDNIGVAGLQLLINDNPVVIDANGLFTVENAVAGTLRGIAIATDAAGNTGQATFNVDVVDTSDVNAPTVSFSLDVPEDGIVTAPTDIIGTISDDGDIDYYTIEVAPVAGGQFKEILRVDNPDAVTDGVLGKFDPSLLQNDSYRVRLSVYDTGGNGTFAEEVVDVAGELKLGNFRLSFTDLEVPVTGIPITLTRTYDTLTSNDTDDFGYGWRMEFRDTDLRTSLGKPTEEDELLGRKPAFKDDTRVYITLPGGKREGFTFKPSIDPISGFLRGAAAGTNADPNIYRPKFEADDGVTSTLTVKDERIIRNNGTSEFFGISGSGYNPADSLFGGTYILTTKEGIEYEIDGETGDLLKVTDTNGNTLTYTDEAVTSSTGQKITFERDAEGRITSVKDPSGYLIRYEYDDNGDLVSVTDREENVTRMKYNLEREHYLDKIIDPLGREGVRNEYGEDGKLARVIDVNGEAIELVYDPDNSTEITKDLFGNPTTYVYDDRGNILTEIDPVGKVTKRTYDSNNNVETETIITDESGAEGWTTTYTYDSQDNMTSVTDRLEQTIRYTYNEQGDVLSVTDPLGNTTSYTYDGQRNLTSLTDAAGNTTEYGYNSQGNITSVIDANGESSYLKYDAFGNLIETEDALGNKVTFSYDENNRLSEKTEAVTTTDGLQEIIYGWNYNLEGQITSIVDPQGNSTQYEYDAMVIDSHKLMFF